MEYIFPFLCKQGEIVLFGVEWVGKGPDVTLMVLFGSSMDDPGKFNILYISHLVQ